MPFGIMPRCFVAVQRQPGYFNQSVPFDCPVTDGFTAPWRVRIVAIPKAEQPRRFCVNLKNSEDEHALHFNARWDEQALVLNSTKNGGQWQNEERPACGDGEFPFQAGQPFTLDFVACEGSVVKVFVNGERICEFDQREDFANVTKLEIDGDLAAIPLVCVEKQQQQE